eukprot:g1612.t1
MKLRVDANARAMDAMRGRMLDAAGMGYVLAKAISSPINAAREFENVMADVNKVVDFDTPDGLKQMSADILALSREIPVAATGIAEIVAAAGQAGMKGDELLAFAKLAAQVGVAFDLSADQTGESLAKIKTALGLTVEQTSELADVLNHLSNNSASSASDLLDFMRRVGSAGTAMGFSARETAAIGSAMVAAGAQADVAATSFRNVAKALARGDSASKRQHAAYKKLGLSATDVAKRLQKDAVGTLNDVIARIRALPKELQASTISDLFGDEARAIMPLIENAELLSGALGHVADETIYLGSAQDEFAVRAQTFNAKLQGFQNRMTELAIVIGNALLPALTDIMEAIMPLITRVAELAEAYPEVTAAIVATTAGLVALNIAAIASRFAFLFLKGGVLNAALVIARGADTIIRTVAKLRMAMFAGLIASSIGGGGTVFGVLGAAAAAAAATIKAAAIVIGGAIASITWPIALLIAAVAALGLAVYRYWEPIREFSLGFAEAVSEGLSGAMAAISGFTEELSARVSEWATNRLVDVGKLLGLDETEIRATLRQVSDAIAETLEGIVEAILSVPAKVGSWISDIFSMKDYSDEAEAGFRDAGRRAGKALIDAIIEAFNQLWEFLRTLPDRIVDTFPFSVNSVSRTSSADIATKPLLNGMKGAEFMGEGDDKLTMQGQLLPFKIGGLIELEALREHQKQGTPLPVMRGDGVRLGTFMITSLRERHRELLRSGVGAVVQVSISLKKVPERQSSGPQLIPTLLQLFDILGYGIRGLALIEQAMELNPSLTGPFLPIGAKVTVPDLPAGTVPNREVVTLFGCSLALDDAGGKIRLPQPGASVAVRLQGVQVFKGIIDSVKSAGSRSSGRTLSVSAKGFDVAGKAKEPQRFHQDNGTVKGFLQKAAKNAGFNIKVDPALASIARDYIAANGESFLHVGEKFARELGATFKLRGTEAVLAKHGTDFGLPKILGLFNNDQDGNLISWDIEPVSTRKVFKQVIVPYFDRKKGLPMDFKTESGALGEKAIAANVVRSVARDESHANDIAEGRKQEIAREGGRGRVSMDLTPEAQAEALFQLKGTRAGVDGTYRIVSVTHKVSRSGGATTDLELQQPQEGAGTDSRWLRGGKFLVAALWGAISGTAPLMALIALIWKSRIGAVAMALLVLAAALFTWHKLDKSSAVRSAVTSYVADVELAAAEAKLRLPLSKIAAISAFAIIGAALPKDLTARQRVMTFFVGFIAALVFGEPMRELMNLSESWAFGMAGILAMTGRNIAVFIIRASRDPKAFAKDILEIWRGVPKK